MIYQSSATAVLDEGRTTVTWVEYGGKWSTVNIDGSVKDTEKKRKDKNKIKKE